MRKPAIVGPASAGASNSRSIVSSAARAAPACGALAAAQATRAGASIFAVLEDRGPGDESRAVAVDTLHEPTATSRQVVHDLGLVQAQPVEIDDVDVGAQPRAQPAAILETKEIAGFAGLHLHQLGQWQAGSALPVAAPVAEHE